MKKLMVGMLVLLLLVPTLSFADTSGKDFVYGAGIQFGMSLEEAKSIDGDADTESDDMLLYDATIAGHEGYVAYFFTEDQLTQIFICFTAVHEDANDYISDFEDIDVSLHAKYGEPTIDNFYSWSDNAKVNTTGNNGPAIKEGNLIILSDWEVSSVEIGHVISGDGENVTHGINYFPMETEPETKTETDTKGL